MSTRLYPLYQRGNPHLRVFLSNFNVICVRPCEPQPTNVVTFHCSMKMTKHDVLQYLTKIYRLPIKQIKIDIQEGESRKAQPGGYIVRDEDVKVAYVTLANNETFKFPELFPLDKVDKVETDSMRDLKKLENEFNDNVYKQNDRPGIPSWFGI